MKFQTAVYMPKIGRTEMLSTVPCSKFRGASFLKNRKNVKFQTAVYLSKIGRTEMLSTIPCSKFRGAYFLKNQQKMKISNGCLPTKNRSYRNVKHRPM